MNIKIVTCQCGTKVYTAPYIAFKKNCPSCKRQLSLDEDWQILSDGIPCTSVSYPFNEIHYFTTEYPKLNEEVFLVNSDYSVSEITWGLMFSPPNFDRSPLLNKYPCWIRR